MENNAILEVKDKNVLITGASGMIAGGIILKLVKEANLGSLGNLKLFLLIRNITAKNLKKFEKLPFVKIIDYSGLHKLNQRVDIVFHTASPSNITQIQDYESLLFANLGLLEIILNFEPQKIIYLSTSEIYGGGDTNEESMVPNFSRDIKRHWYPLVKAKTEERLQSYYSNNQSVSIRVIRLFHTFGPGLSETDGRAFADFLWGAAKNREVVLLSPGEQVRTFLFLEDAISGIFAGIARADQDYFIYNLGSDKPFSILEFATKIAHASNAKVVIQPNNTFLHSPISTIVPNLDRLKSLGWEEKFGVDVGIIATLKWINSKI